MRREIAGAVGEDYVVAALEGKQRAREFGGAAFMMMSKRLAVGRNRKRCAGFEAERGVCNPFGQLGAVGESIAEGDSRRQFAVVSKDGEIEFAATPSEGTGRARLGARTTEISLARTEDNEPDSGGGDRRERVAIGSAFRQPHPERAPPEAHDEVLDTPCDLQVAIARRQQWQIRVIVRLRNRVAVTVETLARERLPPSHRAVRGSAVNLHPSGERRPEVEIKQLVIVADMDHRTPHRVRMGVGGVAFAKYSLVPVLKRRRAMLGANQPGPRAFARGLIEVAVNYDVTRFSHLRLCCASGPGRESRRPV